MYTYSTRVLLPARPDPTHAPWARRRNHSPRYGGAPCTLKRGMLCAASSRGCCSDCCCCQQPPRQPNDYFFEGSTRGIARRDAIETEPTGKIVTRRASPFLLDLMRCLLDLRDASRVFSATPGRFFSLGCSLMFTCFAQMG